MEVWIEEQTRIADILVVIKIEKYHTLWVVYEIEHTECAVAPVVGWLHALASITQVFPFDMGSFFFLLPDVRTVADTGHSNYIL